jgi:hypothetical protein
MYSFYFVYVFLLHMFRSRYCVSLCCSVYCLFVNVYCSVLLPAVGNQIAFNEYTISFRLGWSSYKHITKTWLNVMFYVFQIKIASFPLHLCVRLCSNRIVEFQSRSGRLGEMSLARTRNVYAISQWRCP